MSNWLPLIATLFIQAMVAMALLSLPVVAPVVAQTLQVSPALVGLYVSVTYAGAMVGLNLMLLALGVLLFPFLWRD